VRRVLVAVGCIAAWWLLASLRFSGRQVVATPLEVLASGGGLFALGADLVATATRAAVGLALGVAIGLALGVGAALLRARLVDAIFDFARSIPPVVLLPGFLLVFGWNDGARIATIAAGSVWVMALAVTSAASAPRSLRRELLDVAGASRWQALVWTQPWESLAILVVGLRTSASMSVIVAVVAEMVAGADRGIGTRVVSAQIAGDTVAFTQAVLAIGAVGWSVNLGLRRLEQRLRR